MASLARVWFDFEGALRACVASCEQVCGLFSDSGSGVRSFCMDPGRSRGLVFSDLIGFGAAMGKGLI